MEKTKTIDLSAEEQEVLRKFHEDKRKALLAQLSEHDSKIEQYGGTATVKNQTTIAFTNGFPSRGSKPAQVMFVIIEFKRLVTFSEVVNRISQYLPAILNDRGKINKEDYRTYYGAIFSKVKSEDLKSIKRGEDLTLFGLPDWFVEGTDNPKEEYK